MKKLITALLISSFVNSASADSYSEDLKRGFRQQQAILRQAEQQLHKETNRQAASSYQQTKKLLDRNKNHGEPVLPRIPANNNSTYTEDLNYEH